MTSPEDDLNEIDSIVDAHLEDGTLQIVRDEPNSPPWDDIRDVLREHGLKPMHFDIPGRPVVVNIAHVDVAEDHYSWYER